MDFGVTNASFANQLDSARRSSLAGLLAGPTGAGTRPRFNEQERRWYLKQYGSQSNAYFTLQHGVQHFDLPGVGFISYFHSSSFGSPTSMLFTRPVCSDENLPVLVDAFLRDRPGPTMFVGMDAAAARVLERRGYSVNQIGVEFNIPLQDFKVRGRQMKYLRTVQNYGKKGVEVRELPWSAIDPDEVRSISEKWMRGKKVRGRELRVLTRPPEWQDAWGVRKFYCFVEGKMVGHVFFDPFFKDGRCIGYCANILRCDPEVQPRGVLDYTILQAMDVFKPEGAEVLALGMAPCYDVQSHLNESPLLRRLLRFMYERCGFLYSFQDLAFHKTRYRGEERRVYACLKDMSPVRAASVALRTINLF